MSNLILTDPSWTQRVRDKLGIDTTYLPDTAVQQPDIISVAEANIIDQVPDYATLTGSKRTWLEAATVCECAALLCPSMAARLPSKEQGPHFTREVAVDWNGKRQELEAERDSYIVKIVDIVAVPHFGLSQ